MGRRIAEHELKGQQFYFFFKKENLSIGLTNLIETKENRIMDSDQTDSTRLAQTFDRFLVRLRTE